MHSPDRLASLLRQRALISQHLAWLDTEIAAHSATPADFPSPAIPSAPTPAALTPPAQPSSSLAIEPAVLDPVAQANARADEIINRYRDTEALNPADTRRSCLLLLAAALLLSTALVIGIYWLRYR